MPKLKDPAFLFYPEAYIMGTMLMTFEEQGKYVKVLCVMHQKGRLTEKAIKILIGEIPDSVKEKFKIDDSGLWYNERLEVEKNKRSGFTSGRISNLMGGHMEDHMETSYGTSVCIDINKDINKDKKLIPPKEEEVIKYFQEKGYKVSVAKKAFLYYSEMDWHDSKGNKIKSWKGKMVAVWFKDENRELTLKQMTDERKRNR